MKIRVIDLIIGGLGLAYLSYIAGAVKQQEYTDKKHKAETKVNTQNNVAKEEA